MKRTRNDIRKKQIGSERKYENGRGNKELLAILTRKKKDVVGIEFTEPRSGPDA